MSDKTEYPPIGAILTDLMKFRAGEPTLDAENILDLVAEYQRLRAEVERLREALRSIRTYCGERAEAGARGDWEGLCALADEALGRPKE